MQVHKHGAQIERAGLVAQEEGRRVGAGPGPARHDHAGPATHQLGAQGTTQTVAATWRRKSETGNGRLSYSSATDQRRGAPYLFAYLYCGFI